jgi:hypothetical protein
MQFIYDKKHFAYGSRLESLAINVYNKNRNLELVKPIFNVVDPSKANELIKQYKSLLFPEMRYDDLKYLKKSKDMFAKLRGRTFSIKTI